MTQQNKLCRLLLTGCLAGIMAAPVFSKDVVLEFDALAAAHPSKVEVLFENDFSSTKRQLGKGAGPGCAAMSQRRSRWG